MDWGMKNRLSKIINPRDGHTVMLAVDHGYFMGPAQGLYDIKKTCDPLLRYADTLMLTRGALRNYIDPSVKIPIVLRVSGGTSIVGKKLLHEGTTVSMQDALRLNVSGVAYSIMVGAEYERDTILGMSEYIDWCEEYGVPMLAVTAVGREMVRDAKYLGLATRIAAEHGAHVVKTYYCEDFHKIVDRCPVPIVIAGGKKQPELDALQMAFDAMQDGAIGVDMGRNVFQSDCPVGMMRAVNAVVHKKATAKEAFDIYEQVKKQG